MEQRSTYGYIFLGTCIRFIADATPGNDIHGDGHLLFNLDRFRTYLERYEFHVTMRVAIVMWRMADGWKNELAEHKDDPGWAESRKLQREEYERLFDEARTARDTLLAEADGKMAFIASDKRYTVEKLLTDIGSLMSEGVFEALPDLAKFDFEQGGRALAFELPTAAAFHFLRATEASLRDFYCSVVRQKRIREPRMWAAMISDMRGKRNAPPNLLLDSLDSLRSNFRNPTQHPEMVYEIDEAQDLLAMAIDSINRMAKHQRELETKRRSRSST